MQKFVCVLSIVAALAIASACSHHGSSTAPTSTTGKSSFDLESGAMVVVGKISANEYYVRYVGNMNYIHDLTSLTRGWNGVNFNQYFVNGSSTKKFVTQAYNDVATVDGTQWRATLIRAIAPGDIGASVNTYLRIEPVDNNGVRMPLTAVEFANKGDSRRFMLLPSNLRIGSDSNFTITGPLPPQDAALTASSIHETLVNVDVPEASSAQDPEVHNVSYDGTETCERNCGRFDARFRR